MQIVTKYSYPRRNVKIQRFVSDVISSVVENSTRPLVSTSARQCWTRIDTPGTRPTGGVCRCTHRRENLMTAM